MVRSMSANLERTIPSVKSLKHGNWNFDYVNYPKSNIYTQDIESFDNNVFKFVEESETNDNHGLTEKDMEDFRHAAMIHKVARKKALTMLFSGAKLADLVLSVENIVIRLCKQCPETYFAKGGKNSGIAFPVGVNINNVVAHDSMTTRIIDQRVFCAGDVVKVDIGVHINGRIIDSAFTHIITDKPGIHDHENVYNSVLDASRESVFSAIKMAGPDQRIIEISETIDEIIRSHEVDIVGEMIPVKPIKGIGGHNIEQYKIHGGKLILSEPDPEIQGDLRMSEDEIYAIETYASTGFGVMTQNSEMDKCTHFVENDKDFIESNKAITKKDKKHFRKTELYDWIQTRHGLPFSSSWIDYKNVPRAEKAFKTGIQSGQIVAYPPLYDEENSVVAQFEHTIHINDRSVEILSLGEDY
jgi:methionyl aminopeptidase